MQAERQSSSILSRCCTGLIKRILSPPSDFSDHLLHDSRTDRRE